MASTPDDRILKLCNQLIAADGQPEFSALAAELRSALTKHIEHVRAGLVDCPISSDRKVDIHSIAAKRN
jgi:hypothetical protein